MGVVVLRGTMGEVTKGCWCSSTASNYQSVKHLPMRWRYFFDKKFIRINTDMYPISFSGARSRARFRNAVPFTGCLTALFTASFLFFPFLSWLLFFVCPLQ